MKFVLSFLLVFLCVFATAQVPPMVLGGPQGISSKRVLAEQWLSIPVMVDTPAAPLTGAPWPEKGYIVHVTKANDTTVWHYTGKRWQRIGGAAENKFTQVITGGGFTRSATLNRFTVEASTYYIKGQYYSSVLSLLLGVAKTPNANGRIDIIALEASGPVVIPGTEALNPVSPSVSDNRIKIGFVYYPPFDSLPTISGNGIEAIFRRPGVDSIFFSTSDTTLSIKDSIGVSTASNGLTANDKNVKIGGSLTENTNINLSTRRLNILAGSDTARFFANGSLSLGATPSDSTYRFNVNGGTKTDSLVVDSLYAKFGRYIASPSTPFAPIEFRVSSSKTRIDLRPSSSGGWNSNWYGAITHDGYETDILSAPYGGLYLGATGWAGSRGIFLGNTRNNPSMRIRENNNVLIGDTAITAFKFDVNGTARVRDTLTLATSPVTTDTTANDLLVINSSNGQVRRYTGNWPVPSVTALNGLVRSNDTIRLGGTLTQSTTINASSNGITINNLGSFTAITSSANIGNPSGESIGVSSGRARVHKVTGSNSQGLYVSDSIFLQHYNGSIEVTSPIQSSTTDTSRFQILTINKTTGSLAYYTGAWPSAPLSGSATLDFPSTNNGNESDLTITVTGASEGDVVSLGIPNSVNLNHSCFTAWVSATNTVTVRFNNYGTGALNPASGTFKIKVFK